MNAHPLARVMEDGKKGLEVLFSEQYALIVRVARAVVRLLFGRRDG